MHAPSRIKRNAELANQPAGGKRIKKNDRIAIVASGDASTAPADWIEQLVQNDYAGQRSAGLVVNAEGGVDAANDMVGANIHVRIRRRKAPQNGGLVIHVNAVEVLNRVGHQAGPRRDGTLDDGVV